MNLDPYNNLEPHIYLENHMNLEPHMDVDPHMNLGPYTSQVLILTQHITGRTDLRMNLLAVRLASINQILDPWLYVIFRKSSIARLIRRIKRCLKVGLFRCLSWYVLLLLLLHLCLMLYIFVRSWWEINLRV